MTAIVYRARSWYRSRWPVAMQLAVVVAVVGGTVLLLVAGASRTATAPERFADTLPSWYDLDLEQGSGAPRGDELASLAAIDRVEMATFFFGGLVPDGAEEPVEALPFVGSAVGFSFAGVEGRLPDDDAPGEFVATRRFVDAEALAIGDELTLITITQRQSDESGFDVAQPDGPTLRATLVGIVDIGVLDLSEVSPIVIFGPALLEQGDIGVAAGVAIAGLSPGATIDDVRAQLAGLEDGDVFRVRAAEPVAAEVRVAVDAQAKGIAALALIVAAAAIVVLVLLLSRVFHLSETERGLLGAIGFGRVQGSLEPVARAGPVVLGGCLGAVAVAIATSGLFPTGFARRVEPDGGVRFDALAHVGGAICLAAVVLLILWLLTLAQRGVGDDVRPRAIDGLARAVPSARLAMGLRVAFGRGPRSGSTAGALAGIVLVGAVVIGGLTFGASITRLIDEPARYGHAYDLQLGVGAETVSPELLRRLETNPAVDGATLYGVASARVGAVDVGIVGMEPLRGDLVPEVIKGRLPQSADELALGGPLARSLDVEVGDTVTVSARSGRHPLRITGIAIVPAIDEADVVGHIGLVTDEGLRRIDPAEAMSTAIVRLTPGAPADIATQLTGMAGPEVGHDDVPTPVVNLGRIRVVPFLVAAIVGALGLLALGQLVVVAARRHRRDFAILRALGATSGWIGGAIHWHATVTVIVTAALAVPLGIAAGGSLYRPYAEQIGARSDVAIPFPWIGGTVVALLVGANAVAAVLARRSRRPDASLLTRE